MPRHRQDSSDGLLKASSALGRTVLRPEVTDVLDDFKRLTTDEAKARFADHFLSRTAHVMDEIWPTFYELLKRIEEGELYKQPGYLGEDRTFTSFEEYFEFRVGRPFKTWADMEATYHYAKNYARELFEVALGKAISIAQRAMRLADSLQRASDEAGVVINSGAGHLTGEDKANRNIITITPGDEAAGRGTRASYLARRIARDRPDILSRMAAGEYRSVRAAALEAGIALHTQSVRMDDAKSAARTLRKHMPPDVLAELITILTRKEN